MRMQARLIRWIDEAQEEASDGCGLKRASNQKNGYIDILPSGACIRSHTECHPGIIRATAPITSNILSNGNALPIALDRCL